MTDSINKDAIQQAVAEYYTDKLKLHGTSHAGVDWNSTESQYLRFRQLLRLHDDGATSPFSVLDYGCGYGELVAYLQQYHTSFVYCGYDIAPDMIVAAQKKYPDSGLFTSTLDAIHPMDYVMASGIFNVRLSTSNEEWWQYIIDTLAQMWGLASKGMAFNCLTSYSDKPFMRDYLYYTDPMKIFDYCKRHIAPQVAVLHDYGLYEFTILVRRGIE